MAIKKRMVTTVKATPVRKKRKVATLHIRIQYGNAKSADPWDVLTTPQRQLIDRGLTAIGEVVNVLNKAGWRLKGAPSESSAWLEKTT